jgi:hypothetical protein
VTLTPVWASGKDFVYNDTPAPTAGVWQIVEFHYLKDVVAEAWVAGTQVWTRVPGSSVQVAHLFAGVLSAFPDDNDVIAYIADPKFGTTRGDDDIFADDFETNDLSAWTTSAGSVSVVDDPYGGGNGKVMRAAFPAGGSQGYARKAISAVDEVFGWAKVAFGAPALAVWAAAEGNVSGDFINASSSSGGGGEGESIHVETVDIEGPATFPEPVGIAYSFGTGPHDEPDWTRVDDPDQPSESD